MVYHPENLKKDVKHPQFQISNEAPEDNKIPSKKLDKFLRAVSTHNHEWECGVCDLKKIQKTRVQSKISQLFNIVLNHFFQFDLCKKFLY